MNVPKWLVIGLISLCALLLGIVIADKASFDKPLFAQEIQTASEDYIMSATKMESDIGNLWVIDKRAKRMACYLYDRNNRRMILFELRDLRRDFNTVVEEVTDENRRSRRR